MDHTRFEIDTQNEDHFLMAQEGLVDAFGDWSRRARETEVHTSVVRAMLEYKWDAGDGALLDWTSTDVEGFLRHWLPGRPPGGVDSAAAAAGTVRAFAHFLLAAEVIGAVDCDDIEDHLDAIEEEGPTVARLAPYDDRPPHAIPDDLDEPDDLDKVDDPFDVTNASLQISVSDLETADALLESCADLPPDMAVHLLVDWCAAREPESASVEVADVVRAAGDPLEQSLGFLCLDLLGPRAAPGVHTLLDRVDLAGAARVWLVAQGTETADSLEDDDVPESFVDVLAMRLAVGDAAGVLARMADTCPSSDMIVLVERCSRVDHPNTTDVLEAFVHHHPDRVVSQAARRSLFRVRSDDSV